MKHMSIFSINNTFTKLKSIPMTSWLSKKVKFISTIGTPVKVIIILILVITLHCKCLWNKNDCVPKYTRPHHLPPTSNDIKLETISAPVHGQSLQMTQQVIQEILKSCDVDLVKFECYKFHQAKHQATKV